MMESLVKMGIHGRFVIPAEVRRSLGMQEGDELLLRVVDDELRITTPAAAIARAQRIVGRYVSEDRPLVDELLRERREEALGDP